MTDNTMDRGKDKETTGKDKETRNDLQITTQKAKIGCYQRMQVMKGYI
jgi:hypothetical protein